MRSAGHALIFFLCAQAHAKSPDQKADEAMQLDTVEGANRSLAILKSFDDYPALWRKARACAWLAEEFIDKKTRAQLAEKGIEYGERAIALEPDGVEGHYYLAENRWLAAETRRLGLYAAMPRVRNEALAAVEADEKFDHAGPLRLLGAVYALAPGWPASIGDPEKAIEYLDRALAIDFDYPETWLRYAQAQKALGVSFTTASNKVRDAASTPEYAHRLLRWKREAP
jgi:tetratricopeptide (TPR) repeat protein